MNSPASGVDVMDTTSFEGAGNGAWNCDALPESTRFNVPDLTGPQSYKKQKLLGKAAVFNIASTLPGADKDEQRVLEVLPQIGFKANDIYTCRDTNYSELETALTELANADYSQSACVLVWVLGHGSRFYIDTAKGTRPMLISDILSMFKEKKSLSGKPKIFIFETCHGSGRDFGHEIERSKESWPIEADVAVYYAAPDGYAALVHPVSGSRFTQCLCSALVEYDRREHFVDIATMTNHMVASIENQSGRKQVPMLQHTLTKRFYFFQPK